MAPRGLHAVPANRRGTVTGALALASLISGAVLAACSPAAQPGVAEAGRSASPEPPVAAADEGLALAFHEDDFAGNDALLETLVQDRFRYFRYVNGPFSRAVCRRFAHTTPDAADMPTVNLHGDAHLEQYAVALDGRGLADFDAATLGPPVMDWMRFAASLWLVAGDDLAMGNQAVAEFVRGYRAGLADPHAEGPEPSVAKRMRSKWGTPTAWLDGVERLMVPVSKVEREHMTRAHAAYVAEILEQNPDLTPSFFDPKNEGGLKMGIGSAHEEKMLIRVEGATAASDDDVILEIKQLGATDASDCTRGDANDARRVIVGQSRLGSPQRFLGTCGADDKKYYVHAWRMHYRELDVADVHGAAELAEIAYDVGLQLGKGHPNKLDRDGELRRALGAVLDRLAPTLAPASRDLANGVTRGWERFRADACRAHPMPACRAAP